MAPHVGTGGVIVLLIVAIIAAYFNAKADKAERLAALNNHPPPPFDALPLLSPAPPATRAVPSTPIQSSSTTAPTPSQEQPTQSPTPPAEKTSEPTIIVAQSNLPPSSTPEPVAAPLPTASTPVASPLPPSSLSPSHSPPSPESPPPPRSRSVLPIIIIIIIIVFFIGGFTSSFVLKSHIQHPPPHDAGVAWAAAMAKLPRPSGRLPVSIPSLGPLPLPSNHPARDVRETPQIAVASSSSSSNSSPSFLSSSPAPSSMSSSSSSPLKPTPSLKPSHHRVSVPPSSLSPLSPASPAVVAAPSTPISSPAAEPTVRSDLAISSSRFMMGVVGKGTPAQRSDSSLVATPSPSSTTDVQRKGRENGSGSGSAIGSASMLVDAVNSEDGARKEEARLARSMSKKGQKLNGN